MAKNVSDESFDNNEITIKTKITANQKADCFLAYFMAHNKAINANRKHNNSSRDFTLLTTSVWIGWATKRIVIKKGKNKWLCLKSDLRILYKSSDVIM